MRRIRKCLIGLGVLAVLGTLVAIACHAVISAEAVRTYHSVAGIPKNRVGLVLGCSQKVAGGRENAFFQARIEAAHQLFQAGKIEFILVSGDNHVASYDEPTAMKNALVALGVPAERIVCDYAGFTTLDSVVRAQKVFQQSAMTVISQQFHNERAIYLARAHGVDAIGFNAPGVGMRQGFGTYIREAGSRVKAVWDVRVRGREPKFLGPAVPIGNVPSGGF
jgi:SanA protein